MNIDIQKTNIEEFQKLYEEGWGNVWPTDNLITYFHNIVKRRIKNKPSDMRILEFACGTGANLQVFRKLGSDCYGIDVSQAAIDRGIRLWNSDSAHMRAVNVLKDCKLGDIWGEPFDFIYCTRAALLFDNAEIVELARQFSDNLKDGGIVYISFYTTNTPWPVKKIEEGLYIAEESGTIDGMTYLNLVSDRQDIERLLNPYFNTITILRTITEYPEGELEELHYFGYK